MKNKREKREGNKEKRREGGRREKERGGMVLVAGVPISPSRICSQGPNFHPPGFTSSKFSHH